MARKRTKVVVPQAPAPVDTPAMDREALIAAYQAGLITAWKHEGERGYRLTMSGQDQYIEPAKLGKHLGAAPPAGPEACRMR
jgi:hypothetical protein